jgi:hypothetical protein
MNADQLPHFTAMQDGYLFRVYVTRTDLLCVRLGKGPVPTPPSPLRIRIAALVALVVSFLAALFFMLISLAAFCLGGIALVLVMVMLASTIMKIIDMCQTPLMDEVTRFEQETDEQLTVLQRCDESGIRDYIREKKRGFVLNPKKLENARIDLFGTWKRLFLGEPTPYFVADHPAKGRCAFAFRKKFDVAVGMSELQNLLGNALEISDSMRVYDDVIEKYERTRD